MTGELKSRKTAGKKQDAFGPDILQEFIGFAQMNMFLDLGLFFFFQLPVCEETSNIIEHSKTLKQKNIQQNRQENPKEKSGQDSSHQTRRLSTNRLQLSIRGAQEIDVGWEGVSFEGSDVSRKWIPRGLILNENDIYLYSYIIIIYYISNISMSSRPICLLILPFF